MTIASHLAQFVIHAFKHQPIPASVKTITIKAMIDQYGLQIAGSEMTVSKVIYHTEKNYNQSTGKSSITRYGDQVSPVHAAFINASFAHSKDFDDSHLEAQTHAGSVVIPAAMALAEAYDYPPDKVLKAISWGMEILLRLSWSLSPACMKNGHHTCPTIGPFGAAIACGLLMDLSERELCNALGICGSFAGGLLEFSMAGGSVKRIYPALGARHGLEAVLLAKSGLTAPASIIEGNKGLWSIFGQGSARPERLLDHIGEQYLISSMLFKPYSCCLLIHPALDAFLQICSQQNLQARDIAWVRAGLSSLSASHVGSIIIPEDELGAQFSTSFMLALSLIQAPPGMWSNISEALSNPEILALAQRISVYENQAVESEFPASNGCIMELCTNTGERFTLKINNPKGSLENPCTEEEIKHKFLDNVSPLMGADKACKVYQQLSDFEGLHSIKDLFEATIL